MSDTREWTFIRRSDEPPGTGEKRVFTQAELTIDGELHLFGLIAEAIPMLQKADFPFDDIPKLFPEDESQFGPETLKAISNMAQSITVAAPDLITRAVAVALGIFPRDINQKPNKDFDDQVLFLRQSIHVADVVEMFEVFIEQNDIERLKSPFVTAWEKVMAVAPPQMTENLPRMTNTQEASATPSTEPSTPSSTPDTDQ